MKACRLQYFRNQNYTEEHDRIYPPFHDRGENKEDLDEPEYQGDSGGSGASRCHRGSAGSGGPEGLDGEGRRVEGESSGVHQQASIIDILR